MTTSLAPQPSRVHQRAPRPAPRWWREASGLALWALLVAVAGLWSANGGFLELATLGGALTSLGRLTGLIASALLLVQVLLMARVPWFEQAWGQDKLARTHRLVGFTSFTLLLGHILLITLGYAAGSSRDGGRVAFDPLGLVKGWAVAGASAHLETVPAISWSIGAGGDVVVGVGRGMSGTEPVWRIGIEDPTDRTRAVDVVRLRRGAVATSGAAARGAHIVDPRSGHGLSHPGSATVVGPDLSWADVWATAVYVDPALAARVMARNDPAYRLLTHRHPGS